jgi:LysR family cys regulon transcriptional activator
MAFDPATDGELRFLPANGLFPLNTTWIAIRRGSVLRGFAYRFIELCSSYLDEKTVREAAQS